jgi:hypothetical protein
MRKPIASSLALSLVLGIFALLPRATADVEDQATVITSTLASYGAGATAYGPSTFDVSAAIVVADDGDTSAGGSTSDGCQVPGNVAGKLAVIDRGICAEISKTQNAQTGGAIGVVLVNILDEPFALSGSAPSITIPTVGISSSDGNELKADIAGGPMTARLVRTDTDNDFVQDADDNCSSTSNQSQTDTDGDGQGDACDVDDDNDTISDAAPDNCQLIFNTDQANADQDASGDACDSDDDNDGWSDLIDRCDRVADPTDVDDCPDFTRTATKPTYDKVAFKFAGTFTGTPELCETGFVYLYKERRGADLLMGQTKTGDGTWDITLAAKAKRGKYYAFIDTFTSDDVGECLAVSSPIKVIKR